MSALADAWRRAKPSPETTAAFVALCAVELIALGAYVTATPGDVTAVRYLLYPFAWLNAAVLAVWRVDLAPASRRRRLLAALVGGAYVLALAWVGGLVSPAHHASGVTVYWHLPPGWGPLVVGALGPVRVAPTPYQTVGYLALGYLVAAAVRDADASLAGLAVGAFSCVSCTLPLLAAVVAGVTGGAVGVAASAAWSYDLSTLAFLAAVCLLAWRPDAALLARLR